MANDSTRRLQTETCAESSSESGNMEVVITSPTKHPRTHVRARRQSRTGPETPRISLCRKGKTMPYITPTTSPRQKRRRVVQRHLPAESDDNDDKSEVVVDTPQRAPKAKPQPQPGSPLFQPAAARQPAISASISVHTFSSSPPPSPPHVISVTGLPLPSLPAPHRPALGSWCRRAHRVICKRHPVLRTIARVPLRL